MKADALVSRLQKAKATGRGTWIACCPAHEDHRPSMTIRETDDGTVLVHCFAGCSVPDILGAVGLEFDALFPDRTPQGKEFSKPLARQFPAHDVLASIASEILIASVVMSDLRHGREVSDSDLERLDTATSRLLEAHRLANGR